MYIKRKGTETWHRTDGELTFGGYKTVCGLKLPPRDLTRLTDKRPANIEYCGECHRREDAKT